MFPVFCIVFLQSFCHHVALRVGPPGVEGAFPADVIAEASRVLRKDCGDACLQAAAPPSMY